MIFDSIINFAFVLHVVVKISTRSRMRASSVALAEGTVQLASYFFNSRHSTAHVHQFKPRRIEVSLDVASDAVECDPQRILPLFREPVVVTVQAV